MCIRGLLQALAFRRWAVFFFTVVLLAETSAQAQAIRVGGTGGALSALRQLGAAFTVEHPGVRVDVLPSMGSGGGIRALSDGAIDIAVTGRPLTAEEQSDVVLNQIPFAVTPIAFLSSHPQELNLAPEVAVRMFSDPEARWPDGTPVRVIVRPETESDLSVVISQFAALRDAFAAARRRPDVPMATTDQENVELAVMMEGSLTVGTVLQVWSEGVRLYALPIDGVAPTLANLGAGRYPMGKQFFLVVREDTPATARSFIDFVHSEDGQMMLRRFGALPVE